LPKDFTSRGGGSRLDGEDGGGRGSSVGLFGGGAFHVSHLGLKDFHKDAPSSAAAPKGATPPSVLAQVKTPAAAPAGAAPASPAGAAPLSVPFTAETDLRDAVAAHAAVSPRATLPVTAPAPLAPASPEAPDSFPIEAACAAAAAIGLGAYAFRRSRRLKD
jgi:hypothetical protein